MNELTLLENKIRGKLSSGTVPSVNWKGSLSIQRLLGVVSSIIAEEYITIAKQNPNLFINNGETK